MGITPQETPQESKSASLSDANALELFGVVPTLSGVSVSAQSALRVPAVACATGLIAETMGSLPAKLHDRADKTIHADHPAHKLIHREANPFTSAAQLREQLTLDALLYGAGHALVLRNGIGEPSELHRIEHGKCQQVLEADGEPYYLISLEGGQRRYAFNDILRIEAFGATSPIKLAREAIGLALQFEGHMSSVFANGGRPSGVIKSPKSLNPDAKAAIAKSWFKTHSGSNAGGTAILDEEMDYQQLSMTLADAQFSENRLEQIREIARAFRVPPTLLFELTRGTWSNTEQMMRQFLTLTLRPWIETWEWGYARCLLTDEERDEMTIAFDTESLLSADHAAKATAFSQYRAMGAVTANEVRHELNLPAIEGGDVLENPYITSEDAPSPDNESGASKPMEANDAN